MKEYLIHIEEIKKPGAKLQFQIKLPKTICAITGIQVTLVPQKGMTTTPDPPNNGEDIPAGEQTGSNESERGWLQMRIPERRDVFYAENTFFPSHLLQPFYEFNEPGLTAKTDWWFSGKLPAFYSVDVPLEDTLIEGFYVDQSTETAVDYQLKIYLRITNN